MFLILFWTSPTIGLHEFKVQSEIIGVFQFKLRIKLPQRLIHTNTNSNDGISFTISNRAEFSSIGSACKVKMVSFQLVNNTN